MHGGEVHRDHISLNIIEKHQEKDNGCKQDHDSNDLPRRYPILQYLCHGYSKKVLGLSCGAMELKIGANQWAGKDWGAFITGGSEVVGD